MALELAALRRAEGPRTSRKLELLEAALPQVALPKVDRLEVALPKVALPMERPKAEKAERPKAEKAERPQVAPGMVELRVTPRAVPASTLA